MTTQVETIAMRIIAPLLFSEHPLNFNPLHLRKWQKRLALRKQHGD
jgi:hypothetical protein